jgi:hypothetical protein
LSASPDDRAGASPAATKPLSRLPSTNLREPVSELIGGEEEVSEILSLAAAHRLVTLTGPGGIGKTRLVLAIAELKHQAEKHDLSGYYAYASGFEGQLSAQRGDLAAAARLLHSSLEGVCRGRSEAVYTALLSILAEVLAKADRVNESLAAAEEALQRAERNQGF